MRRETNVDEVLASVTSRTKSGASVFSRRKQTKITDVSTMTAGELQWFKDYSACLKAVGYSYRYISDTVMVQTGIVKAWFEEPEVQEKVGAVQADIVSGAVTHLKNHSVDLIEMLLELARRTPDDAVKLRAIVEGLDRVGITKVNKSESIVTKTDKTEVGFSQDVFERMEALPIETQEKLAQLAAEMDQVIENAKGAE